MYWSLYNNTSAGYNTQPQRRCRVFNCLNSSLRRVSLSVYLILFVRIDVRTLVVYEHHIYYGIIYSRTQENLLHNRASFPLFECDGCEYNTTRTCYDYTRGERLALLYEHWIFKSLWGWVLGIFISSPFTFFLFFFSFPLWHVHVISFYTPPGIIRRSLVFYSDLYMIQTYIFSFWYVEIYLIFLFSSFSQHVFSSVVI